MPLVHPNYCDPAAGMSWDGLGSESASSNTRFSYKGIFGITSILPDNHLGETGPQGTVEQNWEWNERLSFDKNPQCPSTVEDTLVK